MGDFKEWGDPSKGGDDFEMGRGGGGGGVKPLYWLWLVIKSSEMVERECYQSNTHSFPADKIPKIKQKFFNADYPHRFINDKSELSSKVNNNLLF